MPQMMPINWLISFFFFIFIFLMFNIINYFIFNYNYTPKKIKMSTFKNNMIWKW